MKADPVALLINTLFVVLSMDMPYGSPIPSLWSSSCLHCLPSGDIRIINIDAKCTERVIKTTGRCYGIEYHKGTVLLCEESKGLIKIELSDGRITTLVKDYKLPSGSFVTTFGNKIFQTNHVNKSVTCYTINGEKL